MNGFVNPHLLVSPSALAAELGLGEGSNRPSPGPRHARDGLSTPKASAERPVLLDLRPAEQFAAGRIPGAVPLDLWGVSLIDTDPSPMRAFFWAIVHLLELRGVDDRVRVVVYDEQSGVRAARAFWFLEYFGHPSVRLLDGGYGAWTRAGLPIATGAAEVPKKVDWNAGEPRPDGARVATWRDVRDRLGRADAVLLDTRSDGEYCGTLVRAKRGGAIPGAIHIEWTRNLGPDGAFKPADELRAMYEEAGVTPDKDIVTYCQGGYRAAHTYLALRLLGYPRVRNYVGSWKEWGDREDLPVERPERA